MIKKLTMKRKDKKTPTDPFAFRAIGIKALSTVLENQKNVEVFEKAIFTTLGGEEKCSESEYRNIIYQIVGEIEVTEGSLKSILADIRAKRIGENSIIYDGAKEKIAEHDSYLENPFDISEGVIKCKCGSERVYSFSKQTRSSDESATLFCKCSVCFKSWVENS